jgi:hypothetical protein
VVIGFLRFVGVVNAAVWLGGSVFFTVSAGPAFFSPEMAAVLGQSEDSFRNYAGQIAQVVLGRYYRFHVTCAVIAWLHLLAEWLYLGRPWRKFAFSLLGALFVLTLIGGNGLQPRLKALHHTRYYSSQPAEREAAAKSFRLWHGISQVLNVLMIGGLVLYLWRTANPADTPRFISSVKFRG